MTITRVFGYVRTTLLIFLSNRTVVEIAIETSRSLFNSLDFEEYQETFNAVTMAAEYSKGRDFVSSTKYRYLEISPRKALTNYRMNYFHYFLKQLTGYTLHPTIKIESQTCRIADMGTQTTY